MAIFTSSTLDVPNTSSIPRHIAIVMDGNGRWAKNRLMPRVAGHKRGVDAVKRTVQACCELGVEHLTLFAFSSENWRRPPEEVSVLMRLFIRVLRKDVEAMHRENICLRIVGDTTAFEPELQAAIASAQELTKNNTRLYLNIAANYGGRWDILQATKNMLKSRPDLADNPELITEASLSQHLCLQGSPEPDLFILSAPAASNVFRIFYCGSWRTLSFTSQTSSGPTSASQCCWKPLIRITTENVALVELPNRSSHSW